MRKNKTSLTVKIFLITMALLAAACSISVLCMAGYIPKTYSSQLSERLQNEARELVQELGECTSLEDCCAFVDSFSLKMDAQLSISDQDGDLIYPKAVGNNRESCFHSQYKTRVKGIFWKCMENLHP